MPSLSTILYTTFTLFTLPARISAILIYYVPRITRPHPNWTYSQSVRLKLVTLWWRYATAIRYHTRKSLDPGREKDRFIVIDPNLPTDTTPSPYRGIVNSIPTITPIPIGAVWFNTAPSPTSPPTRVVLHFHAGAYVTGGARPHETGAGCEYLSQYLDWPVLQVQYRLSLEKNTHFPAALQDAITAYTYVVRTLQIPPEQIVVAGDSAGGNLVLALLRYLSTEGREFSLPLPRAGLLWSPWVDLSKEAIDGIDSHPNAKTDYLDTALASWGATAYTPPGWESTHPFISPMGNEYPLKTPLFLQTGSAEVLYDEHVRFSRRMREQGTRVELYVVADATHDTYAGGEILGCMSETDEAIREAASFVREVGGEAEEGRKAK